MNQSKSLRCLLALACVLSLPALAAECPQADEASVVQTLNRLYAAADAHDADGLRGVIATDFVAQEDGERVSGQALIERVAAGAPGSAAPASAADAVNAPDATPDPGRSAEAENVAMAQRAPMPEHAVIRQPDVHILCDSAWATFRAPSAMHEGNGGERVESAVLNYQDDGWRVRFLNATVHDAPATPAKAAGRTGTSAHGHGSHGSHGTVHGSSRHVAAKGHSGPGTVHHVPPKAHGKPASKPAKGSTHPAATGH